MNKTYFAYHLTHFFGKFELENYYTNSTNATEGDRVYVISGDKTEEDNGTDYSLEGIFSIKKRVKGPFELENLKGEPRNYLYRLYMEQIRVPDEPISLKIAEWYSRKEIHRFFSSGQNFNPLPTKPNYKERFDSLLAGYGLSSASELAEDLLEIETSTPDKTEREILAKARIGQGKFRSDVTNEWGNGEKCAVTGINIPELLIASHIKPWRTSTNLERLDPANGILLATHIDKLFDRYLASFRLEKNQFYLELHPSVRATMRTLGVTYGTKLKSERLGFETTNRLENYLNEHYSIFIEKSNKQKAL